MTGRYDDLSDEELGRRLRAELPRYAAPAHLRRAVRDSIPARVPRLPWLTPALSAMATALVLILFFVPGLPRLVPADPAERLVRAVVSEHTRTLLWGARRADVVLATLPELSRETGVSLTRSFIGDDQLTLVGAEPVYVDRRRGIAIHYRDSDGHLVSYVAVPAPGVTVPDHERVSVDRYRPALIHDSGFAAWMWRQGEMVCVIVSDRVSNSELETFKGYFLRLRAATEPLSAY
ncbi:MAG: hypothetical protein FJ027_03395 [Candidatus Rokubacteria bacterium]|nr:hypothetical protein [Candidatus Rokubacteria bacterium]